MRTRCRDSHEGNFINKCSESAHLDLQRRETSTEPVCTLYNEHMLLTRRRRRRRKRRRMRRRRRKEEEREREEEKEEEEEKKKRLRKEAKPAGVRGTRQ